MCLFLLIWPILEARAETLQKFSFAFRAMDFQEKMLLRFLKGEALSLGVSWDFPFESGFPKKLQTPPRRQQSIIREGDEEHHPDFYNHTPLVMSPNRLNKSCP